MVGGVGVGAIGAERLRVGSAPLGKHVCRVTVKKKVLVSGSGSIKRERRAAHNAKLIRRHANNFCACSIKIYKGPCYGVYSVTGTGNIYHAPIINLGLAHPTHLKISQQGSAGGQCVGLVDN